LVLLIGWHLDGFVHAFHSGLAVYALFCLVMAPLSLVALRPLKAVVMLGLAIGLFSWFDLQKEHMDEIIFPAFVYTFLHYAWVTTKIVLKIALAVTALIVAIVVVKNAESVSAEPAAPARRKLTRRQREFIARYSDQ
jgi:hypothetical protein